MQRKPRRNFQSPDFHQTKFTPRTRPAHQARNSGDLVNPDPNKKYILAPTDDQHPQNYAYYQAMGYSIEEATKDGVRIVMGSPVTIGKPIEWMGNVLLSCSKERSDEIFLKGPTGSTGQEYYDKLMMQIKRNELEKRVKVSGTIEEFDAGDLEQNPHPVFRE